MGFRTKLFLLFLAAALFSVLLITSLGLYSLEHLKRGMESHDTALVLQDTQNTFLVASEFSREMVLSSLRRDDFAFLLQTLVFTDAGPCERETPCDPSVLFFPGRQESVSRFSATKTKAPGYYSLTPEGKHVPLEVSFQMQTVLLPPGTSLLSSAQEVSQLACVFPTLRLMREIVDTESMNIWSISCFENGVTGIYPAVESLPAGYDPRRDNWYRASLTSNQAEWYGPYRDPVTGQTVAIAAGPIRDAGGVPIGATAIFCSLANVLRPTEHLAELWQNIRTFIVELTPQPDTGEEGLHILARSGDASGGPAERITSTDAGQFAHMVLCMKTGEAGSVMMPYEGRDSYWYYGAPFAGVYVLIIVPAEDVMEPVLREQHFVERLISKYWKAALATLPAITLFVALLASVFSRRVTGPINDVAACAERLGQGDFDARATVNSKDEIGRLGSVFNEIGPRLREHYRMSQSLGVAEQVQKGLLPRTDPVVEGLDVAGRGVYCDETGGDYYDFIQRGKGDDARLVLVMGDVSGHGIAGAMLMATARARLQILLSSEGTLSETLAALDRWFVRDCQETCHFLTLLCMEINLNTRTVHWVSAGHDPPIVYDPADGCCHEVEGPMHPMLGVGALGPRTFRESSFSVGPGQLLLIGTDGIWETFNPEGEIFGKERLHALLKNHATLPAQQVLDRLYEALEAFRHPLDQNDDVAAIMVKVRDMT